jgi:putative addiction module component (TIGR02574 family)
MDPNFMQLPVKDRIRIIENLWHSIASDQKVLPLTSEQVAELDRRLHAYETKKRDQSPISNCRAENASDLTRRATTCCAAA